MSATRRILGLVVATAVLAGSAALSVTVASAASTESMYVVTFKAGTDPDTIAAELRAQGRDVQKIYRKLLAGVAVKLTPTQAQNLQASTVVDRVELDIPVTASDTRSGATWGIDRTDQRALPLDASYSYPSSAGAGTFVYVVDTGVRATHTELAGRVAAGYNAVADALGTDDCNGHGTHVAATAAGTTYGMANKATIVPVRVLDCAGSGSLSGVLAGLDYVAADTTRRPAVLNMSLGGAANTTIDDSVNKVIDAGVLVVTAAGNGNVDACTQSPSRVPAALTVGATTNSKDTRATYSNYGTCLDLFAPGSSITSAWYTSDTATNTISGTSMASPHVAGAAALLLGETPSLTPAQLASALITSATANVVTSAGTGSPNRLVYADPTVKAPANDAFANAVGLTVTGTGSVTGSSLNGSKEAGEPNHAGNAGGGSIWYRFTPSSTAPVTLSTSGSGFDTLLGVYTGTSVGALTAVAANDNAGSTVTTSSVTFTATAGVTYQVAVDGANGAKGPVTLGWTVTSAVSVSTTSLPAASIGVPYSASLAATGGTGTYTWSLASGTLPDGLTLSSAGIISGTPTASVTPSTTTPSFTVAVTDGGTSATKSLSIAVAPAVTVTTTSLPNGTVNVAYSATLAATGGTGSYTWAIASGSLPAGLSLSTGGAISGKPTAGGTSAFTVRATDSAGRIGTQNLTIAVASPLAVSTTTLPPATLGVAYSAQLVAGGGTGTYTWSLAAGVLPNGLSLASSGAITGTPGTAGTFSFTVAVNDGVNTATGIVSVAIASPVTVSTIAVPNGTVGVAYSATLAATGGTGTYTWSVASGSLPSGVGLSSTGVLSGTPTTAGTFSFTVRATDSAGRTGTQALTATIAQGTVSLAGAFNKISPAAGTTGVSRSAATFTWASSTGATSYEICIATTTSCGTGSTGWVSVGSALSTTRSGLGSKVTYYWQVRAVNSAGATLANSGTWWKFVTTT